MNVLDEDLNESDLFCKSHIQKRKSVENINLKSKQLKLNFNQISNKTDKEQVKVDYNSSVGNLKGNTIQDWNSKFNESQSSYFSTKKPINTCPLCLKSFKTDSMYSVHMKQCAKTHKMTTQQLLGALELQKKQMQERRNLGLSSQIVISEKQSASKKRVGKDQDSYDLALGLALSKSLTANESRTAILPEASKSTLKEFGFTSSSATATVTVTGKRKNDGDKKSLLRERMPEDRQRIIIEKVAVVLLDEDKVHSTENGMQKQNCSYQNGQDMKEIMQTSLLSTMPEFKKLQRRFEFQKVVPQLWSKGENNSKSGWYVHGIKKFVSLNENDEVKELFSDNIENEIEELNLPQKNIYNDWRKIINNKTLSDFVGKTKDGQDVHLHSVVLYARSPELLERDFKSIFEKFNLSTILIFLEYIYCGTLNGLLRREIDNLFNLAREFDYNELIEILNSLKSNLPSGVCGDISKESPDIKLKEKIQDITIIQTDKREVLQDKNLSIKEVLTSSIQNGSDSEVEENGDSSNTDKSYWSFMQHQKKMGKVEEFGSLENEEASINTQCEEKKANLRSPLASDKINELPTPSDDSTTKDWDDLLSDKKTKSFSDCIILSSGSETNCGENFIKSQVACSRTPSPIHVNHEAPLYDPYDNFYCTTEEPFSPVGLHSQSLITGDISVESPKESSTGFQGVQDESNKTVGYCSTPVTVCRSSEIDNSSKHSVQKSKRKRCDLSSSRLLRKSLGIRQKRNFKTTSSKKNRKAKKSLAEVLTNSVLNELSGSSAFDSCPLTGKNFIEITPVPNREEFADSVTPSPNYSNMEEPLLKEQLAKYGLKKSLAKSKAKKILRLIYDELHPLYNTKTGKIVKMLPGNTPKGEKKSKPTSKLKTDKNGKPNPTKNNRSGEKIKRRLNSSKESENLSGGSIISFDRSSIRSSEESDFESLNEPLTQSLPTNPMDLPSAFCEFLQNRPEYHQKILLYEPIWLEDLQKKLKEDFKKHFKMSDLMDFLDQKCIAFRSVAQAKKLQKRYEVRKANSRKQKTPTKENST